MTEQADKYRQAAQQMERLAELDEEEEDMKDSMQRQLGIELKFILAKVLFYLSMKKLRKFLKYMD